MRVYTRRYPHKNRNQPEKWQVFTLMSFTTLGSVMVPSETELQGFTSCTAIVLTLDPLRTGDVTWVPGTADRKF